MLNIVYDNGNLLGFPLYGILFSEELLHIEFVTKIIFAIWFLRLPCFVASNNIQIRCIRHVSRTKRFRYYNSYTLMCYLRLANVRSNNYTYDRTNLVLFVLIS